MPLPYLTSNLYINFPFQENVSRLSAENVELPVNFLADAVIRTDYSCEGAYLKHVALGDYPGSNPYLDFDVVAMDGAALATVRVYKEDYGLLRLASKYDSATRTLIRFVLGNADFDAFASLISAAGSSITFTAATAAFSEHSFDAWAKKVSRYRVSTDVGSTWKAWRSNTLVRLEAGSNILLEKLPDSPTTGAAQIMISAIAGAGSGVSTGSSGGIPSVDYLAKIGDATPDDLGNVRIEGDTCYRVELYPDGSENSIRIWNDCDACCKCSDYECCADGLAYIQVLHEAQRESLENCILYLNNLIDTWNTELPTKRKKIFAWATAKPMDNADNQYMIAIAMLNNSGAAASPQLTITLPYDWKVAAGARKIEMRATASVTSTITEGSFLSEVKHNPPDTSPVVTTISAGSLQDKKMSTMALVITRNDAWDGEEGYSPAGTKNVTIVDATNKIDCTAQFIVHENNYITGVTLAANPNTGSKPVTVTFTIGISPANIYPPVWTYSITCGDGGSVTGTGNSTTATASYTYTTAGTFTAVVAVTNGGAPVTSTPITITIS